MTAQLLVALTLALTGTVCAGVAVWHERRMQRHRRPGVGYADVTLRRDGGWRRTELFTDAGLRHQRRASALGLSATLLWLAALAAWILLGVR